MKLENPRNQLPFSARPYVDVADLDLGTERNLPESSRGITDIGVLQDIIDNLTEQVALVDASGRIVMVNRTWVRVASAFHLASFGVGDNYRELCEKFEEQGYELAGVLAEALREFDDGLRSHFEHTYSMQGPKGERFFRLVLWSVVLQNTHLVALASYEITDLVALKRRNRELELTNLHIQQSEGRRIGRDIHDTTAQELTVLNLTLARLKAMHPDEQSHELFDVAENALANVIHEIRSISFMLHPPSLDHGLVEALGAMSRGFARRTPLKIDFTFEGAAGSWREDVEQVLYRIAQEALSNTHNHAAASNVRIRLIARRVALHLIIEDDGVGIAAKERESHHAPGVGIASMRSRINELGGRFSIRSVKSGTRVTASAPLSHRTIGLGLSV